MKKRILYAEASYEAIVEKNGYFVDKTEYIARLELVDNPVFLRPRRFGKSLLCTMLECYYDIRRKERFEALCITPEFLYDQPRLSGNSRIQTIHPSARRVQAMVIILCGAQINLLFLLVPEFLTLNSHL